MAVAQDMAEQVLLRLVVEGEEARQRKVAPGAVERAEQRPLLAAVGRVHRRVEVDRDPPRPPPASAPVARDHRLRQRLRQPQQLAPPRRVLEPRQRRLRRQRRPRHRIPTRQQLHHRIPRQTRRVVAVGVAAGNPEHALPEQTLQRVRHLRPLAPVRKARREPRAQPQPLVARLQQNRAAVGTAQPLVKPRNNGLLREIREQHTLFGGMVRHAEALLSVTGCLSTPFSHSKGFRSIRTRIIRASPPSEKSEDAFLDSPARGE